MMKKINKNATLILLILLCSCAKDDTITQIETNDSETELFYYSTRDGVTNIYKSDLQGNETPIIVDNEHQDWWIRVSPDKSKILWYKSPLAGAEFNNYEEAELWMANIDGGNPEKIIDLSDYNWTEQGVADWSPDGSELVMAARDTTGNYHIFITDSIGDNPIKISQRNSLFADPSWSPDGQKIVYSAFPVGYIGLNIFEQEIHIMNRDGSNEIQLTDDDFRDNDPYWSPDGKEITFETNYSLLDECILFAGKWSIRKYSFETEQTTDVVNDAIWNTVARWTENSEFIYFARVECGEYSKLVRTDRNGNNMESVLSSELFPYHDCDIVE